jgi:hypothetical protein
MKVEIYDDLYGRFHWTLLDGPDGIDGRAGSADSYDEACKEVVFARTAIAQQYADN